MTCVLRWGRKPLSCGGDKHQEIADRTAATLCAIDRKLENFYALLDGSNGCAICGRPLRDEISKLVGVGPECASKQNIPHNLRAAEDRLTLRKKLLGSAASTDGERSQQTDSPALRNTN